MNTAHDPSQLRHWLALIRAPGIGPATGLRLLQHYGDPATVFAAGVASWKAAGLPLALQEGLRQPDGAGVEQDLRWLAGDNRHLIAWTDERYPALLREITHAPLALFCHGDPQLLARRQLAIVGARAVSRAGAETAEGFAAELTRCGLLITSGLALGVDGAAHRGALPPAEYARRSMPQSFAPGWSRAHPQEFEALLARRLQFPTPAASWLAQYQACAEYVTQGIDASGITVPALVIHGRQDRVVPHANGALLARRLPRADFVSLEQAGHLPFLEDPAGFAQLVRGHLRAAA